MLRRDLLDETEAPQEHSCGADANLGVSGCTEGYLDGPYDFAYSRIDRYMDTSSSLAGVGIKAQMQSIAPGIE